ncbi:MAG: iron-containing alcohol dehydrogenase [Bacteroidales bacterium]|nr:iron-containing alcohol dehydrogenase [Bacteroidales bacterium]
MYNFSFQNPTKLIFGKGSIAQLSTELPKEAKIMITFGGGSVKKNGVYEQVIAAMKGFDFIEFWGIEANPKVETLRKAIALGKQENVNYLLAVGGGSIIDGTKLIAAGIRNDHDAWDIVRNPKLIGELIPLSTVLTISATGSEMNDGAVISCLETKEKFAFHSQHPKFSILDPEVTYSLPLYQIACGIADTFVHVMEQYLTAPDISPLMDRWAEGILQTLIEIAPAIMENPKDYDLMSSYMLCATMGLNGFIAFGVPQDWCTHMIGHELTALHGVTHGESLAVVLPGTMTVLSAQKGAKILQYGQRVWGIDDEVESVAIAHTINKTEQFFRSIGLKTRLSELDIQDDTIDEIERRFNERHVAFGECNNVTGAVAKAILECCK